MISKSWTIANSVQSKSALYDRTLLAIVRIASNFIMHTQIPIILQGSKLCKSCLNLEFGRTENVLDVLRKYKILECGPKTPAHQRDFTSCFNTLMCSKGFPRIVSGAYTSVREHCNLRLNAVFGSEMGVKNQFR
jgi:hypothetical protein